MEDASKYGRIYYCIKVEKELAKSCEIYAFADEIRIIGDGALALYSIRNEKIGSVNLIIPSGKWRAVYSASVLGGHAVCVEHWKEEIDRGGL
jgi:hypothetical protein